MERPLSGSLQLECKWGHSSLGWQSPSRGNKAGTWYTPGVPYSLPVTDSREDSVKWEEEKLVSHNMGLKIQFWAVLAESMQLLQAGHMLRFVPLLSQWLPPGHTADTSALIHHGVLSPNTLSKGCSGRSCHQIQKSGTQRGQKSGLKGHHQSTLFGTL